MPQSDLLPLASNAHVRSQVAPGTSTAFKSIPAARRRHARLLHQALNLTILPPDPVPLTAGAALLPPCPAQHACSPAAAIAAYVSGANDVVVHSECLAVQQITDVASIVASGLQNDTLYRVLLVSRDASGQEGAVTAYVRTQDLKPPLLTLVEVPPPDFTSFQLVVALNEIGTIFAGLHLASAAVTASPACPPAFTVRNPWPIL
jgi:hypothetical protein